jgi:hypothetical protein
MLVEARAFGCRLVTPTQAQLGFARVRTAHRTFRLRGMVVTSRDATRDFSPAVPRAAGERFAVTGAQRSEATVRQADWRIGPRALIFHGQRGRSGSIAVPPTTTWWTVGAFRCGASSRAAFSGARGALAEIRDQAGATASTQQSQSEVQRTHGRDYSSRSLHPPAGIRLECCAGRRSFPRSWLRARPASLIWEASRGCCAPLRSLPALAFPGCS